MEEEGKQITCLIVCGCGGNRSLFETSSPTLSKKLCSFSPSRFSSSLLLDHLAAIFSDMDTHVSFWIPKVSNFVFGYLQDCNFSVCMSLDSRASNQRMLEMILILLLDL